ncbi:MAG: DNA mismatch repair protein MutS [Bdellovibrio sp.]|nr:DNA mismatch repair protein MutS [Bdellovibrio sp.]
MTTNTPTLQSIIDADVKLTPMLEQYYQIKKNYPDTLLLFRMGDFYEVFFEDADLISKVLNIAKTHRGKIGGIPIPMAGIPHHAANAYIDRLTGAGLKVAICEQIENPKDAVGIVKRAVTQIVTPSLPYDLDKTAPTENNFLAAMFEKNQKWSMAFLDFTTGEFCGASENKAELLDLLHKYSPKEILTFKGQFDTHPEIRELLERLSPLTTHLAPEYFDIKNTRPFINKMAEGLEHDRLLKEHNDILNAIGALTYYVSCTQQVDKMPHLWPFRLLAPRGKMRVSLNTLMGLEIIPRYPSLFRESVLGYADRTKTAMGARALRQIFLNPLKDLGQIGKRQQAVTHFFNHAEELKNVREKLENVRDLERILAKASTGKALPGDLHNFANSLTVYFELEKLFDQFQNIFEQEISDSVLQDASELMAKIGKAINDELGASAEKGNLIREGHSKDRDRLKNLVSNSHEELQKLEDQYKEKTGISKLRIRSNSINGFFIEVTKSHIHKVPKNFERRQTLVNAERYTTPELLAFEKDVTSAQSKLEKLERAIFQEFLACLQNNAQGYLLLAQRLAMLDILQSLAWLALQENFVCPQFSTETRLLSIKQGRHPLIEASLKNAFVAHDMTLDDSQYFALITGPNMAGKTTVMREVAIIQFLAQIGSYVPAKQATLSLVDHLFCRLGASDDIQRGQSTFMVEMAETAEILRHATHKSLIIIDEVGRGTSTYDGLSIAWALVEYFIKELKAFTLFATHYHELINVVDELPGGKNLTVDILVQNGHVQFLYHLVERGAAQSFGLYVAKLAGIPRSVLRRSEKLLQNLEQESPQEMPFRPNGIQLSFLDLNPAPAPVIPDYLKALENAITRIDLTRTTPLEALLKLKDFQDKILTQ